MARPRLALCVVLVLAGVGFGASCRNNRVGSTPDSATRGAAQDAPAPAAAHQGDVTAIPGIDLADLSASERESFWSLANEELSTCGDPYSLAVCARDRRACRTCVPALRFLARMVRDGRSRDDASEQLRLRYSPANAAQVNTTGAPSHGPANAPVTLVEFSDYECPHCAHAIPIIRQVEHDFPGRLRVVHMNFPLSGHTHAMAAARAALAAGRQGKFWEMHELLFTNQRSLETADLNRYAQQLGLDMARFRADSASPEVEAAIQATRREGERLEISGTPTIFINGRRYELPIERPMLRDWIQEDLDAAANPH
ncbi:MAG: thioredoxin domain-containing protein [Deltaproteobacteria bacterium]|nr:thioredoxin domain-containing protein [Deltaproteobacteria bacterium]